MESVTLSSIEAARVRIGDDGDVYLCPKCLAVHAEYFRVMAEIENERKALNEKNVHGGGSPV